MPHLMYGNGPQVFLKDCVVAAVGIKVEVVNGVFLALGPKAFSCHIAANRGQYIKADATQQCLKQDNGAKRPDDAQQQAGSERPRLSHAIGRASSRERACRSV